MLAITDRAEIEELYARYCIAVDSGDVESWAQTYTEDGAFVSQGEVSGRVEILKFAIDRVASRATKEWTEVQHWVSNLVLDGDDVEARGFCYMVRIGRPRVGERKFEFVEQGYYQDRLKKVNGRWLFTRRMVVHAPLPAPDALFD